MNDPSSGKHCSLPFLPAMPLSWTLVGLFELTRRLLRALDSPCALLPELQRYKDTVRFGPQGTEVLGHCQEQLTQNLIVRLLKTHFFLLFQKLGGTPLPKGRPPPPPLRLPIAVF